MLEVTALHHVSIVVDDLEAARHFYGQVLGMEEEFRPTNFRFGGAWFVKGSAEIHLIHRPDATQDAGDAANTPNALRNLTYARHFCLAINDVDAAVNALAQHSVPIAYGPRNRGDGAIQTYVYDPDGHLIELVCLHPTQEYAIDWDDWQESPADGRRQESSA